ncbi:MAG TPA: LuxR C-terminal-related transcriptional regulator [Chloroflexia bacterium]|nr:LuxR C-terminal-related transcriptional regulator [Chloroflexia bacterium]
MHDVLNERERDILGRLAGGSTDRQIADELFLSLNTVKWYNRQIYSKLGVRSRTQAIAHARGAGLLDAPGPEPAHEPASQPLAQRSLLPAQTTPFIGRGREIAGVRQLLARSRLLVLTGAGGTGKTRLALRVAETVAGEFSGGATFVDLAPVSHHSLVAAKIAAALGISESPTEPLVETLKRALAGREMLLVVDNFEHVIEAAPLLSELLAACPQLRMLVTSRESLRLAGEQEYQVPPLSLPRSGEAGGLTAADLSESEAGTLFVRRAQMTRPDFEVSESNAGAIGRICIRLDGLPLAIELAAARSKVLTPHVLLERLEGARDESPLRALGSGARDAPARHRTLRDTMAWSYNLLDDAEKRLFARLAVFRGGWSLEAAESVCGGDVAGDVAGDVFDGLASLVDKSLVQQKETPGAEDEGRSPRFTMLEMVHEYAREQLEASGEAEAMRRHAEYFLGLAERAEPELRRAGFDHWCGVFELEMDNLRAALEWAAGPGDLELGVRLAGALGLFWYGRGYHREGIRWTEQLLGRLGEVEVAHHPQFLLSAGHLAFLHDMEEARRLFTEALAISRRLGDREHEAWAMTMLSYVMLDDPEAATPVAQEGLALFRELGDLPGAAQALNIIGEIARLAGDDKRARRVYEECLEICRVTGEVRRICYMCNNLAYIAQHEGDHERAIDLLKQALVLARDRRNLRDMADALEILAGSTGMTNSTDEEGALRAARILGATDAARERLGSLYQPADQPEMARIFEAVRERCGGDTQAFRAAWAEGRRMTLEKAAAYALGEGD